MSEAGDVAPAVGPPRVVVLGENSSMKMGGEASYPYFIFKLLRERGVEAWLVAHERTRDEMLALLPGEAGRMHFIPEARLDVFLWKLGSKLPRKINEQTLGMLRHVLTGRRLRRLVAEVVVRERAEVVHETTPISPKAPSAIYGLGVPVVAGPLSGAMDYPPAFRHLESTASRLVEGVGRVLAHGVNWLVPGRIRAESLIVANDQTIRALPKGHRGVIYPGISEVSVDSKVWALRGPSTRGLDGLARFAYLGRLVDWKGVDVLIEAFRPVVDRHPEARLAILGDGEQRGDLEAQAARLGLSDHVEFAGWVSAEEGARRLRESDVFVLTSLRESGGIVLLEAMACGLPVVATRWGGPAVHVDNSTGIRVAPDTRGGFVRGLADAMIRLAGSPELRREMGLAATRRVESGTYDWDRKIDRFLEIYAETIARHAAEGTPTGSPPR